MRVLSEISFVPAVRTMGVNEHQLGTGYVSLEMETIIGDYTRVAVPQESYHWQLPQAPIDQWVAAGMRVLSEISFVPAVRTMGGNEHQLGTGYVSL